MTRPYRITARVLLEDDAISQTVLRRMAFTPSMSEALQWLERAAETIELARRALETLYNESAEPHRDD
jgi:hypothetical protein